ncbi:MAG: beta-mannanase [Lentisphaeria bacterium]|nr:beta-mannanase [Lentisphaeria bacterium]
MQVGCNYWASHAGVKMWADWREDVVRKDFALMAAAGMQVVRVFPRWTEFQPLALLRGGGGRPVELRLHGEPLPATFTGQAGVDEEQLAHFRTLAEIAAEHGMGLIVGLVTGWMSGELYMPPAFAGLNPITDPLAIKWQVRMVRCMVRSWRDLPAIRIWELGNECNCMGPVSNAEQAWNWTNAITAAIRAEDSSRPVASGMHGLMPAADAEFAAGASWAIETQGELCDLLTSHPYPHSPSKLPARVDAHTSIRAVFQAAVETCFYRDFGRRPAFVEEIGTFAPSYCNEKTKAAFIRNAMLNAWAHGSDYFVWWCAFDQSQLKHPPYDWSCWERELGLYTPDFQLKPVGEEIRAFRDFVSALPVSPLPPCRQDAVCIISRDMNFNRFMENGWSAFMLAKQAGFDLRFQYVDEPLIDSDLYVVPGICGANWSRNHEMQALLERVRAGATLYLSMDDGALSPFEEVFGASVDYREARRGSAQFSRGAVQYAIDAPFRLALLCDDAEILATEADGNPVYIRHAYGRGEVYLLTLPLERYLAGRAGAFHRPGEAPWFELYQTFAGRVLAQRAVQSNHPLVTLTEHPDGDQHLWVVAVNNHTEEVAPALSIAPGWTLAGAMPERIAAHSAILLELKANR